MALRMQPPHSALGLQHDDLHELHVSDTRTVMSCGSCSDEKCSCGGKFISQKKVRFMMRDLVLCESEGIPKSRLEQIVR